MSWYLPEKVEIKEVGPRDGFQMEKAFIPTKEKIRIINALSETGVSAIQVTSVVHPKAVPQLIDAEEVMANIERKEGVSYSVLVPNICGAERAIPMKADEWELMLSVSESHSLANANRSVDDSLKIMEEVVHLANAHNVSVRGGMATALGCPFEGRIPFERIHYVAEAYYQMGVRAFSVADTVGVADPKLVYETISQLKALFPDADINLHLHNTRGMALANVIAGLQAGVTSFDASVGGLGGCPYAPNATGNVATEDIVHMLERMGVQTGINLRKLLAVSRDVEKLVDHPLESAVSRAGTADELHQAPTRQMKIGE
ncbi:hydroxymethylglutaryl-CoA lyase [Tuberibacillus calidus]|jgi:hydroxymethylglutaryl-CoA lyase|uniref:hydroxymethylglutaryl-CoA lyase n=1 Tax=Tuberibacillus calidus TaxID=340097 RepID=UPI0004897407|nr:hydroxymethylglutaryl-CoA lyase [Tuberibacillus calidus]